MKISVGWFSARAVTVAVVALAGACGGVPLSPLTEEKDGGPSIPLDSTVPETESGTGIADAGPDAASAWEGGAPDGGGADSGEESGADGGENGADGAAESGADATAESGAPDTGAESGTDAAIESGADAAIESGTDAGAADGSDSAVPCDPSSCAQGCCLGGTGGQCTTPGFGYACGTGGIECQTCDSNTANSCVASGCSCGGGPACTSGAACCGELFPAGGASCVNVASDPTNCGTCGHSCASAVTNTCIAGACACGTGSKCGVGTACCGGGASASCVDLTTDPKNCGTCGQSCGGACAASTCQPYFGNPVQIGPIDFNANTIAASNAPPIVSFFPIDGTNYFPEAGLAHFLSPQGVGFSDIAWFPSSGPTIPNVQLGWNGSTLNSIVAASSVGTTFTVSLPAGQTRKYSQFQIYATGGLGPSTLDCTLSYATGSAVPVSVSVPDWCTPGALGPGVYTLASAHRVHTDPHTGTPTLIDTSVKCSIYAIDLNPDPARTLTGVSFSYQGATAGSVLAFYGATAW